MSPFISEEDAEHAEEIQEVSREQNSSDENGMDYNMTPRTIQEQVAHHIGQLISGELTARDFRNSPFYANTEYLKNFILFITRKADPNHRKKMPSTPNTVKKAIDQWLDEANKEKRQYFFLKMDGLQAAMKKKYGMQWKTELFEANAKISEKDLLDKLGLEILESNRDAQLSKEMLLTALLR